MKKASLLCMLATVACCSVTAQTDASLVYKSYKFEDGAAISRMSDNGQWAVAYGASAENPINSVGARLIKVSTGESRLLTEGLNTDTIVSVSAYDISNDGTLVVGELNHKPAVFNATTGKWRFLALNGQTDLGDATCITPDGKYAVGRMGYSDEGRLYEEVVALWDLATGSLMPTPGLPAKDMSHQDQNMNRFMSISADGSKVLGCMSYSYLPSEDDLGGVFCYVYDVKQQSYKVIGFDETQTGRWNPHVEGLFYVGEANMSNDGRWVTGGAYMVKPVEGSEFPAEYEVPYLFNVATGQITMFDDSESTDRYGWVVDNDGNVFGATPAASPYRDFSVRSGKYWVNFTQTIKQKYGVDIIEKMGYTNSGTPVSVSDDGYTIASMTGPNESFIVTMPERFSDIAAGTNLLSSYSVYPANGTSFSKLNTVILNFDRNVNVVAEPSAIVLKKKVGNVEVARAVGIKAEGKKVTITFRTANLTDHNYPYVLTIPARAICIDGDITRVNGEITVNYKGRTEKPVTMIDVLPADNSMLGKLDLSTSPITFTYDTDLMATSPDVRGYLYQGDNKEPFAELLLSGTGGQVMAYPATTQYLYKDVTYRVEIPAGCFTDITGNAKTTNEALVLHYKGAYEREISYDDNVLFSDDFSNGVSGFLVYDNDRNTPSAESVAVGFEDPRYGWMPVRDKDQSDMAACSTSLYSPAGKSDDWMVIPQIHVVDQLCKLSFQSQSIRKTAHDRLKVYVWESNEMFNALTPEIISQMRTEGTVIYDELQNTGPKEDVLEGEWTDNLVSLKDFAGKNVYIAFVNENENQSMVCVDNVKVLHELPFYVAVTNDDVFVGKTEAMVKGVVDIRDEKEVFTTAEITLLDAQGNQIDQITADGLSLQRGDKYDFAFNNPLPLRVGELNAYTINLRFNQVENSVAKNIKSLAFQPTKRVVIEEFTGTDCVNCPMGHVAFDRLHELYGNLFIPMALHCYTGDPYSTGVMDYAAFLNLMGAPTGIVQRSGVISSPMYNDNGDFTFYAPEGMEPCWLSIVADEMNKPTEAEVTATVELNADGTEYTVPVYVKYALNGQNLNHKVFAVVLENDLVSYQKNGFASIEDADLGEWGKGGRYAEPMVQNFVFDHVVRGWEGKTFTGTSGLLPVDVEAGKTYSTTLKFAVPSPVQQAANTDIVVMLFDGNTDRLINAYLARQGEGTGIGNVEAENAVQVSARQGQVWVNASAEASVQVFAVDGSMLAQTQGQGQFAVSVPAYKGVVLVKVTTQQGQDVKKLIL